MELKKTKFDFNAAKEAEDILERSKKAVPSWSAFTSLLSSIAVIGSCVLLGGQNMFSVVFKLIMNLL